MSEREKDMLVRLVETFPKLDKDKQNYVLGVADGMVALRESERINEDREGVASQ